MQLLVFDYYFHLSAWLTFTHFCFFRFGVGEFDWAEFVPRFKQKTYEEIKEYVYINFMSELEILFFIKLWYRSCTHFGRLHLLSESMIWYMIVNFHIVNLGRTELPFVCLYFSLAFPLIPSHLIVCLNVYEFCVIHVCGESP